MDEYDYTKIKEVASGKMLMIRTEIGPKIMDILVDLIKDGIEPIDAIHLINSEIELMKFDT